MAAEVEFPELRARMIAAVDATLAKPYAPGRSLAELASLLQSVWDETEKYAAILRSRRTTSFSEHPAGRRPSSPPAVRGTHCFDAWREDQGLGQCSGMTLDDAP